MTAVPRLKVRRLTSTWSDPLTRRDLHPALADPLVADRLDDQETLHRLRRIGAVDGGGLQFGVGDHEGVDPSLTGGFALWDATQIT